MNTGDSTIDKCLFYNSNFNHKKNLKDIFTSFEENLNCAGMCEPELFYFFTDVNTGPPSKESCFDKIGS